MKKEGKVSDDLILQLVIERLMAPDCQINGWVLDGCPITVEQVEGLMSRGIQPSQVITLELSDQLVYERLEQRRFDPVTGMFYYIMKQNDLPDEILNRLVQAKNDTHPEIKKKLLSYQNFLPTLEEAYKKNLIRVNAEEKPELVFKNVCEAIDYSI